MPDVVFSAALEQARSQSVVNSLGTAPVLQVLDASNNVLASITLPNPPAVVFNDSIVFQGILNAVTVSSNALVGAVPASAQVVSSGGQLLITGIPIQQWSTGLTITSSAVSPGQQLGLLTAQVLGT